MKEVWPWILIGLFFAGGFALSAWSVYYWWTENEIGRKVKRWLSEYYHIPIIAGVVVAVFFLAAKCDKDNYEQEKEREMQLEKELREELNTAVRSTFDSSSIYLTPHQKSILTNELVESILPIYMERVEMESYYYEDEVEYDEHGMKM